MGTTSTAMSDRRTVSPTAVDAVHSLYPSAVQTRAASPSGSGRTSCATRIHARSECHRQHTLKHASRLLALKTHKSAMQPDIPDCPMSATREVGRSSRVMLHASFFFNTTSRSICSVRQHQHDVDSNSHSLTNTTNTSWLQVVLFTRWTNTSATVQPQVCAGTMLVVHVRPKAKHAFGREE